MAKTILEHIAAYADIQPDALCIADANVALTYKKTWQAIRSVSAYIQSIDIAKDACIVIECDQSANFIVALFAVQLAGCVAVPTEKGASVAKKLEIITQTHAALIIGKLSFGKELCVDKESDSLFSASLNGKRILFLDIAEITHLADRRSMLPVMFPELDSIAEILFSTGTTGKSKGVIITHANNRALAENVATGVHMKAGNIEIIPMPLNHAHGLRTVYANLANGCAVLAADGVLALGKVLALMDAHGATAMDLSPSMLSIIFKLSGDRLAEYADTLDYVQLGSAPLPEHDKERLASLLPSTRLYNFYGSTESGRSCVLDFQAMAGREHCIGRPAYNATFLVVDENRNPVHATQDNPGLLACAGPMNMKGYLDEPDLTAQTMHEGIVYTRDLGYIDKDGLVYMLGRADDVINYGGVKVSPEELEDAVMSSADIVDCACIGIDDEVTGQAPLLFVVPRQADTFDLKSFKRFLVETLDANMQPKYVKITESIPRATNGKVLRATLREML